MSFLKLTGLNSKTIEETRLLRFFAIYNAMHFISSSCTGSQNFYDDICFPLKCTSYILYVVYADTISIYWKLKGNKHALIACVASITVIKRKENIRKFRGIRVKSYMTNEIFVHFLIY
jgi:hypothetical protein